MSTFEELLAKNTAKGANLIPGVVLTVVDRHGESIYSKASGYTSTDPDAPPITFDSTLIIASCTKLITSVAALQCVERGLVTLDEPLIKHLPELSGLQVLRVNDGPNKTEEPFLYTDPPSTPTLRQMLTHTGGFGYDLMPPLSLWRKSRNERSQTVSPHHDILASFTTPYLYPPGEGWAYGSGLDWAGLLIRRLTNTSLESYMATNIFSPLDMTSTTFYLDSKPDLRSRLAPIMNRHSNGTFKRLHTKGPPGPARDEKGGGGLYSTAADFTAILKDLISPNPKLLSSSTADLLFTPQLEADSTSLASLRSTFPFFSPMVGGISLPSRLNHALGGLFIDEDIALDDGVMKAGTMSWSGAGNLTWFANRREGIAGFYASQVFPPGDPISAELLRAFWSEAWRLFALRQQEND